MTLINYLTGEVASSHIKPKQQSNGRESSFCAQQASVGAFPCGLQFPTPPNPFPHHGHQLFSSIPHLCSCPTILPFPFIHSLCLWRAQSFLHERKLQHLAVFAVASSFAYFPLPYLGECFPNPGLFSHFKGSLRDWYTSKWETPYKQLKLSFQGFWSFLVLKGKPEVFYLKYTYAQ